MEKRAAKDGAFGRWLAKRGKALGRQETALLVDTVSSSVHEGD